MSTADIDLVLSRLEGVRKEGTGWMARCPVHDDRSPSLHVWEDNEGRIAYHCFAGCDHARVREALGLADERRDDDYPSVYKPRGSSVALPIVAKYRYTDEQGRWLYTVGRTATDPSGTKHFPTWRPDPAGPSRVIWGLAKTRRVLYRLSDLVEAAACGFPMPVYVCYSPDTEVLTPHGWVALPDLPQGESVAEWWPGGRIDFAAPLARQSFTYRGEMVNVRATWCDLLVTPDHRQPAHYPRCRMQVYTAAQLAPAMVMPVSGKRFEETCDGPTPDEARLIVAWRADGVDEPRGNKVSWNLKKERKKKRLRELLFACGVEWTEHEYRSCPGWTSFRIPRPSLPDDSKHWQWSDLDWPLATRIAACTEIGHWDGDFVGQRGIRYFTAAQHDADVISAMAATSGFACIVRKDDRPGRPEQSVQYVVNLLKETEERQFARLPERIPYDGPVFCLTVPSGFLVVRRNGKTVISGNCEGEKDVESIEDAGGLATCNPHGAGKWRDEYSEYLRGADVIVIADADEPGRAHAQTVARSLAGVARSVRVVEAAVGKDASDHLAAGHTLDDFLAVDAGPVGPEDGGSEETEQAVPPLEGTTDTGNANRFIRIFGERVRYCDLEGRWYVYDGCRWAPDEKLLVAEWMRQALLTIFEDATRAADDTEARALAKWGTHSLSSAARKAALECAKSDPRVAVHPSEFDRGPYLLNCPNGTLDLKTRELRPHDPGDLLRKVTGAPYDPGARSELWERVVMEATGSDDDFRAALQRAFGYSATGDTREESFFIMAGGTQTGKSTVCLAVEMALGDYAASVSPDTWLERNQIGGTRDDLLRLDGVRMAVSAEAGRHSRMATAMMKAFTGGDAITVRGVYQRDRELRPVTKPWIHTNDVPTMPDDDQAIWRRAVIFPFEHRPAHPDPHVKATLCDPELSGAAVLAWIVEGCFEWQERGLDMPDVVRLATDTVRLRMDPLVDFFAECCEFEADVWTSTADLREAYMKWRRDYPHMRAISPKEWGQRLTARGLEKSKRNGVRGWLGVRLTNAAYTERTLPRG